MQLSILPFLQKKCLSKMMLFPSINNRQFARSIFVSQSLNVYERVLDTLKKIDKRIYIKYALIYIQWSWHADIDLANCRLLRKLRKYWWMHIYIKLLYQKHRVIYLIINNVSMTITFFLGSSNLWVMQVDERYVIM